MARIFGVDIPNAKRTVIALTYIKGIGHTTAQKIVSKLNLDANKHAKDLTQDEIARLISEIEDHFIVEGALNRQHVASIQRLKDIGCYRGLRHRKSLPVRGQRTRCNARTRKGPAKTVAKKKKVGK